MAGPNEQEPDDDGSITDEMTLWRRISPLWWTFDAKLGTHRVTSAAFEDHPDGSSMSVTIAEEAVGVDVLLDGHEGYGVASFPARVARHDCGQHLVRRPLPKNPAHAEVVGRKTDAVKKKLRLASTVLVQPS